MKKVLVIDDEPDVCEFMKGFLEAAGYIVMTASRAAEGLNIIALEKPNVVLLDVVMPDMDGLACLKQIKKSYPETIVVMVSGLQDEDIAKEAIRYGAYDYVTKPFDFSYIQNNILSRIF